MEATIGSRVYGLVLIFGVLGLRLFVGKGGIDPYLVAPA